MILYKICWNNGDVEYKKAFNLLNLIEDLWEEDSKVVTKIERMRLPCNQ